MSNVSCGDAVCHKMLPVLFIVLCRGQGAGGDIHGRRCHWTSGIWLLSVESCVVYLHVSGMAFRLLLFRDFT